MKTLVSALGIVLLQYPCIAKDKKSSSSDANQVRPYTKKDGTRVEGYRRTKANENTDDNWSTKGNSNPETGKKGTKKPN